jgi:macrocin-O-methyltransferase TylF-like protien
VLARLQQALLANGELTRRLGSIEKDLGIVQLPRRLRGIERELRTMRRILDKSHINVSDHGFMAGVEVVRREGRTMLGADRLWILWQAARNVASLELPAAEVGAWSGGSSAFIARAFVTALGHEVPLEVIDTFEGHLPAQVREVDAIGPAPKDFQAPSYEDVVEFLSEFERVTVHKGDFASVAPSLRHEQYGLVHVDVNVYVPTAEALAYFGPRMAHNGVIVVDDYEAEHCPGVRAAIDEYLAEDASFQTWHPHTEQLILVKKC